MRRTIAATGLVILLAALLAVISNAALVGLASTAVTVGSRDFNYGLSGLPFPTGNKSESKLWWNDSAWWGVLWSPQGNAWHIFKFDPSGQDWTDTGTAVDVRKSLVDVLWDGANQKLCVVSHIFTEIGSSNTSSSQWGRLYRYTYGSATKAYTLDSGFPVTVTQGIESTLTIAKDSFGVLWVSYVENSKVMVNHSLSSDSTWGTPLALPGDSTAVNTYNDDVAATVAFGGNKVGVMWSNSNSGKFYFAAHNDGDAATVWQTTETVPPMPGCTGICVDGHLNAKADSTGQIFAAGLTGLSGTTNMPASIVLMVRSASGTWSSYPVSASSDSWVRPVVLLDEQNSKIYTFASSPGAGGVIYYKSSSLGSISFPTGIGTPFIQSSTDTDISNASSTKQTVNGTTGLLVLAADQKSLFYLHNFLTLPGSNIPVISSFTPTSGAVGAIVTINGSKFTGSTGVKFNETSASSFTVNSDTQITTSIPADATTGRISVTAPAGTGTSTSNFTVIGPPVISSFAPTSGAVGTSVTISGSSFTGATVAKFNGTSASSFTVNSDTQISTSVPAGTTTGTISVMTPIGTATSTASFTITQAAGVTMAPTVLNFGSVQKGTSSAPQVVTLANGTSSMVTIYTVWVGWSYTQTNNCGSSLAAGASCTINVTFTPLGTGTINENLAVDAGGVNLNVPLTGIGL